MFPFPRPFAIRGRACYSSFFSNKAGGGRYFTPTKPPKSVVGKDSPSPTKTTSNDHLTTKPPDQQTTHDSPHIQTATAFPVTYHVPVDSKDLKLHQFLSLHRPLLLLSQPTSTLFDQPESLPDANPFSTLFTSADSDSGRPSVLPITIDNPPESSPEQDADTARHLAHALVLNRIGGTVAWESTLRHLGIDVNLDEDRARSKEQCEKEWKEVVMESTKRKRRSKMKKHKLKKRRRATRSQRLKMGR